MLVWRAPLALFVLFVLLAEVAPLPWWVGVQERERPLFCQRHAGQFGDLLMLLLSLDLGFRCTLRASLNLVATFADHRLEVCLWHLPDGIDAAQKVLIDTVIRKFTRFFWETSLPLFSRRLG